MAQHKKIGDDSHHLYNNNNNSIADTSSKSHDEKFKIARKLHCQFGHASASNCKN